MGFINELAAKYNLQSNSTQAWGAIDGYWFQITPPAYGRNFLRVQTAVHLSDDAAAASLTDGLAEMANAAPAISYNRKDGSITLDMKMPFIGFKIKDVENMLLQTAAVFRKAGAVPGCFNCNSERPDSFAMVNGVAMKLCSQCQADISQTIATQTEEYAETKNNFLRGILGAVIGALVGSIAWVVIGLLGYLAAIGGIAISFCAVKGYTLMKGKINVRAIIMICLICIVVLMVAQFLTWDLSFYLEFQKAGEQVDFSEILQHTFEIPFMDSELTSNFIKDCLLGLLFMAVGSYSIIKPLFAKAAAPAGKFERL